MWASKEDRAPRQARSDRLEERLAGSLLDFEHLGKHDEDAVRLCCSERNRVDAVAEVLLQFPGDRERRRRLADAAGAGQRDERRVVEHQLADRADIVGAAVDAGRRTPEIAGRARA